MSNRIFETDEYVVEELEHCYNIMQFKSKLCMDVIVIPKQIMKDIAEKVSSYPLDEIEHKLIQECAIFKRKIFWDYPEDFINLLKTNIKISVNNFRKTNVRN